ncbi:penicillin-binding transpeptidase domain-containing protein [Leptospira perolatii]|uniref:penicillin-binding transpeptidase domain-containing protein n=1 Tax=Leptospira perolatii TaxID=2023191 RepID=UPI0013FE23AB|nr:penicillin-binding transpeptidase domain-containing protein [Leptospira perolatii]
MESSSIICSSELEKTVHYLFDRILKSFFIFIVFISNFSVWGEGTIQQFVIGKSELLIYSRFSPKQEQTPGMEYFGNREYRTEKFSPASTFKSYLALSLLENEVVSLSQKLACSDPHIVGSPRMLNLREALFYSSNDYFLQTFRKLGKSKLEKTLSRIGYGEMPGEPTPDKTGKLPANWWRGTEALKHGGSLRLRPGEIHSIWVASFWTSPNRKSKMDKNLLETWMQSLFWSECSEKGILVYGKSGSWEKSFWFQGLLVDSDLHQFTAITFLNRSSQANRSQTIQKFYDLIECPMPKLE